MKASSLQGSAPMPQDPRAARFLVMAAIRREWNMTREEFDSLGARDVRFYQAFLAGMSEASQEANTG